MRHCLRDSPSRADPHRPEPMPNVTRVISRAIRQRLDWNRIGIAISLLIVVIAAVTLVQLLRDIEIDKVVAALRSKSIREVLIAGVFVAIGYVALSFYDFFALRTIGRDTVPYRVAAFASFTSYTIGHNLGATVFTAGVIRFRIYSAWGLSVIDIVKIAFVTAILLGFLSHAPGSLGVIEVAMLVGLPQFPKEELLATLLIFRFLYFVLPLSLAALLLGLRELWLLATSASDLGDRNRWQLWKMRSSDCTRALWDSAWASQRDRVRERKRSESQSN